MRNIYQNLVERHTCYEDNIKERFAQTSCANAHLIIRANCIINDGFCEPGDEYLGFV